MKNKSLILWIFIVISAISTSALLTIVLIKPAFYSNERPYFYQNNNQNFQRMSMREALNLDENQEKLFMQERQKHHAAIMPIFDSIMTIRVRMFEELKKDMPDTTLINTYVLNISKYEAHLQMESVYHLLNMKSFLNKVQIDSMFSIFSRKMMPRYSTQYSRHGNRQRPCR